MREIKFRAVITNRNATIFFTLQDLIKPNPLFNIRELLIPWLLEGNQPDRFPGLRDKNGKEIYEGDIVKRPSIIKDKKYKKESENWLTGVVTFEPGMIRVAPLENSISGLILSGAMKSGNIEIMGNIYENPELLEVKNENTQSNLL